MKYRYGVYRCGVRQWRMDSRYDFFTGATPAAGMVAIFATKKEALADAAARNPKHDPLPGEPGFPVYSVCDLDEESTYVTGQNVGRSGVGVVRRGKAEVIKAFTSMASVE